MDWILFGIGAFIVGAAYLIAIIIGAGDSSSTRKSHFSTHDDPNLF